MTGFELNDSAFQQAMSKLIAKADVAAQQMVTLGGRVIERNAKAAANGRPGPNVITGSHRRSFHLGEVRKVTTGTWESETGPSMVYSRRLELGFDGTDSLGRVYSQPAYPSLEPGLAASGPELTALAARLYGRALRV